jgi:tRNA pseudouridine38-40 synthase
MRVALGIEYDGTAYNGWQRQKTGTGVQALVEAAVSKVADEPIAVVCAGRTDTGVHASGQVIHFDTGAQRSDRNWSRGVNTHLPGDINITWAKIVDDEFHARFSATARSYRYLILNRPLRSALYSRRAWWVYEPLDENTMQEGADALLGQHDFSAFRAAGCGALTPVREISKLQLQRYEGWIVLSITANAFLQHMVRNITGTLVAIGKGDQNPVWARKVLEGTDRTRGGIAAPPHGLTLVDVEYADEFDIQRGRDQAPLILM